MQNPEALTTLGRSVCINIIYFDIRDLTPAIDGQLIPAESGQGSWLFQGYSKSDLAKEIKVHYSQIGRYEEKGAQPSGDILAKLANALEVT